ncbi:MAG: sensor histidine kinase [Panacagrimonas sp.]
MDTIRSTQDEVRHDARFSRNSLAAGFALAVAAVAAATAARWLLNPYLGSHLAFLTYFLAVLLTAWKSRLAPSVFALLAGAVVGRFCFVEPRYSLSLSTFSDYVLLIDFWRYLITGIATIALCEAMRSAQRKAEDNMALSERRAQQLEREVLATRAAQDELQQARDELEERVRLRTAELALLNESLVRSNRELEQFAAVASHDLQEPLRKVQAFGDRLQDKYADVLGEQGNGYLERVLTSASRMRRLIDDLLAFSRVATRGQPFVPVDLAALAREAVIDLEARIEQTEGQVEIGELPTVDGDPTQIRQLFQNLIANGLKFRKPDLAPVVRISGQIVEGIPVPAAPVTDVVVAPVLFCRLTVTDNGIGFEQQYVDRIFQVFQRLHGRNEYEGTGIGLAICRRIAERHGGSITASSAPDEGASFIVTLPMNQTTQETAAS